MKKWKKLFKVGVARIFNLSMLSHFLLGVMLSMFARPVFAQSVAGGQVQGLMQDVLDTLNVVSPIALTIAVVLVGYRVAFKGDSLADCAPIIIGGVLLGSANQIAQLFFS
jgi:type IV secretion system protein VirB2